MLSEQVTIWNDTRLVYPRDMPVHALIEAQAERYPDKQAVCFEEHSLTYRQLNEKANQLASVLLSYDIHPQDTIALAVERSADMLVALLAILKTGAAYIPLDPEYPEQRINFMLEDAGAKLLLTSLRYRDRFSSPAKEVLLEQLLEQAKERPVTNQPVIVQPDHLAYMIYTSGSTGRPKGVMVAQSNLVNLLFSMQHAGIITKEDKLLAVTTISFDIAALEMFLPLITGASLVIASSMDSRDGSELIDLVNREHITLMQATPVTWKIMLAAGWKEKTTLKILCCGEPLLPDLAEKLLARCEQLYNYYGPTETTIYSTGTQIKAGDKITIGGPIANTQIYIYDEAGDVVGAGKEGEIFIAGDGVARGYKDLPDTTAEKFIDDPFAGGDKKMFRSGDLGKWTNDGKIIFLGRIDQQVKIRGYRIELGEIETALRAQQGIMDAVVTVREDTPDNKTLVAYVVPGENKNALPDITQAPLLGWKNGLQKMLPDYMVPHEYVFMEQLPLLPNGKIDRNALPKPEKHIAKATEIHQSTNEALVTRIWEDALDITGIGPDEDFFELGGHSLIAVQIMTRLERETGKRLPIAALFESPTVRSLAQFLDSGDIAASWGSLVPVKPQGNKPPLYIVHGDGLNVMIFSSVTKYLDSTQPVFGLQPRGLNGEEEPDDSIEKIAAFYIAEIIKKNPAGPYFLAGYSFGGIVAFEMARQLKQLGKKVQMLALFDTNVGNIKYTGTGFQKLVQKIRLQGPKIKFILRSLFKNPAQMMDYQWTIATRKWNRLFGKEMVMEEGQEQLLPHERKMIEMHIAAYEKYILKTYDGRIDLFRVKERIYFVNDPVYLGWKPFASQGIEVHEVPGDHKTFLFPPNDKVFAAVLQDVIDQRIKEMYQNNNA